MKSITAAKLSALVNGYSITTRPRTIVVPHASALAALHEVSVSGVLLARQLTRIDPKTSARTLRQGGAYQLMDDGDLHFCLGTRSLKPHVACEVQNAKAWLAGFRQTVGQTVVVSGFFRCLFEHPGFFGDADAHIFEIHPVRGVKAGSEIYSFDVDIPDQDSINTWNRRLNKKDAASSVKFARKTDTLTFSGTSGMDENYVRISGTIANVRQTQAGMRVRFSLDCVQTGYPVEVYCLRGTSAARQLQKLVQARKNSIEMIALRNIDLAQALKSRYVISLLAIDIQAT